MGQENCRGTGYLRQIIKEASTGEIYEPILHNRFKVIYGYFNYTRLT